MQNETVTIDLNKFLRYHKLYEETGDRLESTGCFRYGEYGDIIILGKNETTKEIQRLTKLKHTLSDKVKSLESSNLEYRRIAQNEQKENLGYKTTIREIEEQKKLSKWQRILNILKS